MRPYGESAKENDGKKSAWAPVNVRYTYIYAYKQKPTQLKYTIFKCRRPVCVRVANGDNSPTAILTINLPNWTDQTTIFTLCKWNSTKRNTSKTQAQKRVIPFFFDIKNSMLSRQFIFPRRCISFDSCVRSSERLSFSEMNEWVYEQVSERARARFSFHSPLTQTNSFHLKATSVSATEHIL